VWFNVLEAALAQLVDTVPTAFRHMTHHSAVGAARFA
jgi:hypothetical protein